MPPYLKITLFCISFIASHSLLACSCALSSFCELVQKHEQPALKVRAIEHRTYNGMDVSEFYHGEVFAAYLEVIEVYSSSSLILTDTIKVYGSNNSAACAVNVHRVFPLGETIITTFDGWNPSYITNPDSLIERYTEASPSSCGTYNYKVNGQHVTGHFDGEIQRKSLQYLLRPCGLYTATKNESCAATSFSVFPNPTPDGMVNITNNSEQIIQHLNVYSFTGQLLVKELAKNDKEPAALQTLQLKQGIFLLEIIATEERCWQKIVVLN